MLLPGPVLGDTAAPSATSPPLAEVQQFLPDHGDLEPTTLAIPTFPTGLGVPATVDRWGQLNVPADAGLAGYPSGDETLKFVLDYFLAFVVTDGNATQAWAATGIPSGIPPINKTFAFDPEEVVFNERDLPALFLWRESSTDEWIAEDWLVGTSSCKLLWVFPTAPRESKKGRTSFVNALAKVMITGLERGRTPGFVVAGDTDPKAATQGSLLYTWAGFFSLNVLGWRRAALKLTMADNTPTRTYDALEFTVKLAENLEYGTDRFAPNDPTTGVGITVMSDGTGQAAASTGPVTPHITASYGASAYAANPMSVSGCTGLYLDRYSTGNVPGTAVVLQDNLSGDPTRAFVAATDPQCPFIVPSAINGHGALLFLPGNLSDHTSPQRLGSGLRFSDFYTASAHYLYLLVQVIDIVSDPPAGGPVPNSTEAIFSDIFGTSGVLLKASGPQALSFNFGNSPAGDTAPSPFPLGRWVVISSRLANGNVGIRLNGGPWIETPSPNQVVVSGRPQLGCSATVTVGAHMLFGGMATFNTALSAQDDLSVLAWFRAYGGLSF